MLLDVLFLYPACEFDILIFFENTIDLQQELSSESHHSIVLHHYGLAPSEISFPFIFFPIPCPLRISVSRKKITTCHPISKAGKPSSRTVKPKKPSRSITKAKSPRRAAKAGPKAARTSKKAVCYAVKAGAKAAKSSSKPGCTISTRKSPVRASRAKAPTKGVKYRASAVKRCVRPAAGRKAAPASKCPVTSKKVACTPARKDKTASRSTKPQAAISNARKPTTHATRAQKTVAARRPATHVANSRKPTVHSKKSAFKTPGNKVNTRSRQAKPHAPAKKSAAPVKKAAPRCAFKASAEKSHKPVTHASKKPAAPVKKAAPHPVKARVAPKPHVAAKKPVAAAPKREEVEYHNTYYPSILSETQYTLVRI